jgi:hypothetical protein
MVTVTVFKWPGTVSTFRDVPVPVWHFGQASVMGTALSGKPEHDAVSRAPSIRGRLYSSCQML